MSIPVYVVIVIRFYLKLMTNSGDTKICGDRDPLKLTFGTDLPQLSLKLRVLLSLRNYRPPLTQLLLAILT